MNNEIGEKYLPIGTVVMLKNGTKRAMITGFCSVAQEDKNKMYDYCGCIYPEGYVSSNQVCLFDHDQIIQVFHKGLVDDEEITFKNKLKEIISKTESVPTIEQNVVAQEPITNEVPVTPVEVVPVEVTPVAPVEPMAPVAPVAPVEPVAPVAPVAPVEPVAPVAPVAPVEPMAPVAPVAPIEPMAPVAPVAPVEPIAPVAPVAPVEPIAPVAPVAPVAPENNQ